MKVSKSKGHKIFDYLVSIGELSQHDITIFLLGYNLGMDFHKTDTRIDRELKEYESLAEGCCRGSCHCKE